MKMLISLLFIQMRMLRWQSRRSNTCSNRIKNTNLLGINKNPKNVVKIYTITVGEHRISTWDEIVPRLIKKHRDINSFDDGCALSSYKDATEKKMAAANYHYSSDTTTTSTVDRARLDHIYIKMRTKWWTLIFFFSNATSVVERETIRDRWIFRF